MCTPHAQHAAGSYLPGLPGSGHTEVESVRTWTNSLSTSQENHDCVHVQETSSAVEMRCFPLCSWQSIWRQLLEHLLAHCHPCIKCFRVHSGLMAERERDTGKDTFISAPELPVTISIIAVETSEWHTALFVSVQRPQRRDTLHASRRWLPCLSGMEKGLSAWSVTTNIQVFVDQLSQTKHNQAPLRATDWHGEKILLCNTIMLHIMIIVLRRNKPQHFSHTPCSLLSTQIHSRAPFLSLSLTNSLRHRLRPSTRKVMTTSAWWRGEKKSPVGQPCNCAEKGQMQTQEQ